MKGSVLTTRTWVLLATVALLFVAGAINFWQRANAVRLRQGPPTDGVTWVDTSQGIIAKAIAAGSAAARAHMNPGDHLLAISMTDEKCEDPRRGARCEEVSGAEKIEMYLDQARVGGQIHYLIERPSYPPDARYYYADLDNLPPAVNLTPLSFYINVIGLVWLFMGLFVIFRQGGRAPFVLHFAGLCVAAFVFHFYTPLGTYKDLDLSIGFLRNAGLIMFAPLFVHFSAIYPVRYQLFEERRWRTALLYIPALALLAIAVAVFAHAFSPNFITGFYKASLLQFEIALVASAVLLVSRFVLSKNTVARQQLKWVVWGSVIPV